MNKAFVREPEPDGRALCPQCGALGVSVGAEPMDTHIQAESRSRMRYSAWLCSFSRCDVAYFDMFDRVVAVDELTSPAYPKDLDAPICPCFGFGMEEIEADVRDGIPTRIRGLLAKSKSTEAQCRTLAMDGRCCMREVQRLYIKLREQAAE